jgi:serine/threonine protein kinase
MLSVSEKRAATLAVSWYGADPLRIDRIVGLVAERRARGEDVDFLDLLYAHRLLSVEQLETLRAGLPQKSTKLDVLAKAKTGDKPATPGEGKEDDELQQIGPYRVLRKLGEGGMGAVYLAFDAKAGRQVAIKVLNPSQSTVRSSLDRFHREGKHGALLNHANIVRNLDSGIDMPTGLFYLVLEFVDGPSAHELLDSRGRLTVSDAVAIVLDVARALEHAHKKGIIHRDLKPANILISRSGLAKLSDMGLARKLDESSTLTNASQGIGTPYYVAYEQAMNARKADERSDIFALGATLYHLLTGHVPFPGESTVEIVERKGIGRYAKARSFNPEVTERLETILAKMMALDPADRYQTASEVIVDLERSQLGGAIPSFVELDEALKDPVMRQRLTSTVQPTSPDFHGHQQIAQPVAVAADFWFVRYIDRFGKRCKSKLTTRQICQRYREGQFAEHVEVARASNEHFQPLTQVIEFVALLDLESPLPSYSATLAGDHAGTLDPSLADERRWWCAYAAAIGLLGWSMWMLMAGHG